MSLFSGQGPVFWSYRNATTGNPTGFHWFGNAPEFVLGLGAETLTHKESYTGLRTTDARIITELTATVQVTVDDFKEANLTLASFGSGSQLNPSGTTVSGETILAGAPIVGERYAVNTGGRVSALTLTDNGSGISTTKYSYDASGVIVFTDVAGMTGPIAASYTVAASRQVGVFKASAPEIHVRIDSYNTASSVTVSGSSDYERAIVDIFKVRLDPAENFGLINDEFGTLVLNGSALTDTLKTAASATGQFARFIYLDPPQQTVPSASASLSQSPSASKSPSASASPS
jgi:hypothetical protein